MSFEVAGDAYDRFMGRYSQPLAARLADWLDVEPGQQAVDVGCGPGALTGVLVDRLGASSVAAIDPSQPPAWSSTGGGPAPPPGCRAVR